MKNTSFKVITISILLSIVLFSSACEKESTESLSTSTAPKIALIMKSLANEFFTNMAEGARQHQLEKADDYSLIINGIKNESDLAQQVALVEQMLATGSEAIVIAPADSKALVPVLKRAQQAGVVVVNIDNKLNAEILKQSSISIPFVGPDNREGARLVGEYLAARLKPEDQVALIGGIPSAFNAQQRQLGFEDAMGAGGMRIVSVQSGEWEQGRASTVAAAMIREFPELRAILCSNDNMAMGAVAAIKQAGLSERIKVVGFDNITAIHPLIRDGSVLATADQYGSQLAIFGIEYALQILASGETPADRKTPVDLVTADSLDIH